MQKLDGVRIKGHIGKWHEVDRFESKEGILILLEHDTFGDEAANLIVKKDLTLVMEDVWNGFDDYLEAQF